MKIIVTFPFCTFLTLIAFCFLDTLKIAAGFSPNQLLNAIPTNICQNREVSLSSLSRSSELQVTFASLSSQKISRNNYYKRGATAASLTHNVADDTKIRTNTETTTSLAAIKSSIAGLWLFRFEELLEYRKKYGHTLVPKRYKENTSLGYWVSKQRQLYRKYCNNEKPCSLTIERIELLNSIGFTWFNNRKTPSKEKSCNQTKKNVFNTNKDDIAWHKKYHELQSFLSMQNATLICSSSYISNLNSNIVHPLPSSLNVWLAKQRKEYSILMQGQNDQKQKIRNNTSTDSDCIHIESKTVLLNREKVDALNKLHHNWFMTRREHLWEKRYGELVRYKETYGDCCVPISFHENKALAQWVSRQRKNYKLRESKKKYAGTALREDRYYRLSEIGFAWDRWEYEFYKKL